MLFLFNNVDPFICKKLHEGYLVFKLSRKGNKSQDIHIYIYIIIDYSFCTFIAVFFYLSIILYLFIFFYAMPSM